MSAGVSRARVLAAARRALSGGARTPMEGVADKAGVSLRTLYRMCGNRETLLRELNIKPPSTARERILETALQVVGRTGLADLSMDELAVAAGVSRATLYRFFPGKPSLFRELIRTYSPIEAAAQIISAGLDRQPDQLIPEVAKALGDAMAGRAGLLVQMVFDMIKETADTAEGIDLSMTQGFPAVIEYLNKQMELGRLRQMDPVIAFQLLAGPIFVHMLTRPLGHLVGFTMPREEVVQQIAAAWLRSFAP